MGPDSLRIQRDAPSGRSIRLAERLQAHFGLARSSIYCTKAANRGAELRERRLTRGHYWTRARIVRQGGRSSSSSNEPKSMRATLVARSLIA